MSPIARQAALSDAWHYGEAWRHPDVCDSLQREWLRRVRSAIDAGQRASFVQRWGRQVGKSWANIALALCEMQRRRGIIIRYAALTGKSCAAIVVPTFEALARTMPASLVPKLNEQRGTITSPNGSQIVFAGTDNEQFDRLRGPRSHLLLFDESAFYDNLEAVERALQPQLNTTNGVTCYFSSPPESPAHLWVQRDAAAQANGNWSLATMYDSPRYSSEQIVAIESSEAARLGLTVEQFKLTTYYLREFKAQIVTEESRAALPAWNDEARSSLVGEWERPTHFDAYVSLDTARWGDPHAGLFAWHDPATGSVVVEDELELPSAPVDTHMFADTVKSKEAALWGVSRWEGTLIGAQPEHLARLPEELRRIVSGNAPRQPYLRVADPDATVVRDFQLRHGVAVIPTQKHNKAMAADFVCELIRAGRLRVHSRCRRLLEQMAATLWNRARSEWERTTRDHGDLVDCLIYLCRNVQWNHDCRPPPATVYLLNQKEKAGWNAAFE